MSTAITFQKVLVPKEVLTQNQNQNEHTDGQSRSKKQNGNDNDNNKSLIGIVHDISTWTRGVCL